ncbi:hypothetical protein CHS0354_032496 [Potamilus streckersoni]|nr:hypothetical protein CHS0354_032496 [Potamilus streckersoni]
MLNSITNDLDLLLSDICHLYPSYNEEESSNKVTPAVPMKTFSKKPSHLENCSAFGESSTSGTLTSTDSNTSFKNTQNGTLNSTDSNSSSKPSPYCDHSSHVFELDVKGLEMPTYQDGQTNNLDRHSSGAAFEVEPRQITCLERVTKSSPIWCLPEVGRSGSVHLLKDRVPGSFVVRKSSREEIMALSVQIPANGNNNVDHYLVEPTDKGLHLQGSTHYFREIHSLITHYIDNQDDLPHKLVLPQAIMAAKTSQELSALAMLGQDFWTTPRFGGSRSSSKASLCSASAIHKSVSEPINFASSKIGSQENLPPNNPPSKSVIDFSSYLIQNRKERAKSIPSEPHGSNENIHSDACEISKSAEDIKSRAVKLESAHSDSVLLHRDLNSSTPDSGSTKSAPHNHKCSVPHKSRSTDLYFTTPIGLLTLPENTYFTSNLSDKLSDYEDIWKNSNSQPSSLSVQAEIASRLQKPFQANAKNCQNGAKDSFRKEENLKCDSAMYNGDVKRTDSLENNLNTSNKSENKISHKGSLPVMFKSYEYEEVESDDEDSDDECSSLDGEADEFKNEDEDTNQSFSVQTQTSPKPSPLPALSKKSASTSTLSNSKSPVYAEPFDAIDPISGENKQTQFKSVPQKVRRKSAPAFIAKKRLLCYARPSKVEKVTTPPGIKDKEIILPFESINEEDQEGKRQSIIAPVKPFKRSTSLKVQSSRKVEIGINRQSLNEAARQIEKLNLQRNIHSDNSVVNIQRPTVLQTETSISNGIEFKELEDFENSHKNSPSSPTLKKFPILERQSSEKNRETQCTELSEYTTVEDLILCFNPELTLKPLPPFPLQIQAPAPTISGQVSEYDNLMNTTYVAPSCASVGTIFCKPWDNSLFDSLFKCSDPKLVPAMNVQERIHHWQKYNEEYNGVPTDNEIEDNLRFSMLSDECSVGTRTFGGERTSFVPHSSMEQSKHSSNAKQIFLDETETADDTYNNGDRPLFGADLREKIVPILANPRLLQQCARNRNPDARIRDYVFRLSQDTSTTFGSTIKNFITCTLESQEKNPHFVTRNVRQFMNGIKNYLVKHGEGELEDMIEHERNKLAPNEILNIDAILESSLHVCVIKPLKQHIYQLFVKEYSRNGSITLLSKNIKYARTKTAEEIGIRRGLSPPDGSTMEVIKHYLVNMQKAFSPLKKLENLLGATSSIYKCVMSKPRVGTASSSFGADDFLPILIYTIIQCGNVSIEVEADYMWGLLHPSLLTGEGGYYLTSLSSAILVLKNFRQMHENKDPGAQGPLPSISDMQGFLKIAIPDELKDSIEWKTLPVRPNMTTKDVCSIIAHKFKITNPQDYSFYILENREEKRLTDAECPQALKAQKMAEGKECVFAYKRTAANIAWPKSVKKS